MSCSRDKKRKRPKKGWYICDSCGQARENKDKLCEPKKYKPPKKAVRLDQKGCRFIPKVFGIMVKQPLEIINSDPYEAGWIFTVHMDDPKQAEALLDAAAYKRFLES